MVFVSPVLKLMVMEVTRLVWIDCSQNREGYRGRRFRVGEAGEGLSFHIYFFYVCFYVCVCVHTCHCAHVEVRQQLADIGSLLPLCGLWGQTQLLGLVTGTYTHRATFWPIRSLGGRK